MDRRLHAYRPDLADWRLKGQVEAVTYRRGRRRRVNWPSLALYRQPPTSSWRKPYHYGSSDLFPRETTLLYGDEVLEFECKQGWSWIQNLRDNYVGYVASRALATPPRLLDIEGIIIQNLAHLFAEPSIKSTRLATLFMGARVMLEKEAASSSPSSWLRLSLDSPGWPAAYLQIQDMVMLPQAALGERERLQPYHQALKWLGIPYLWGGNDGWGMDCSGLVQIAFASLGINLPRDSDLQLASPLLRALEDSDELQPNDLIFWRGHVGMMVDRESMIHANATTRQVSLESLGEVVERIALAGGGPIIGRRRLIDGNLWEDHG